MRVARCRWDTNEHEGTFAREVQRTPSRPAAPLGGGKALLVPLQLTQHRLTQIHLQRVGQDPQRPPLVEGRTRREDMGLTLKEREALYRQAADFTVDTGNKTPEETARAILELLAVRGIP